MPVHVDDFAQVLQFMRQKEMLHQPHFNHVVGALVRDSMETPRPHCTTNYRSLGARDVIVPCAPQTPNQYQSYCKSLLRHEHMVPTNVRMQILGQIENPTAELIAHSLRKFGLRATLHFDEDRELNDAGLRSTMPDSFWDPENTKMFMNPLARYIETGLIHRLVPRRGECWFADDGADGLYP